MNSCQQSVISSQQEKSVEVAWVFRMPHADSRQPFMLTNFGVWYTLEDYGNRNNTPHTRHHRRESQAGLLVEKQPSRICSQKKGAIPINADEIGHQLLKADSPVIGELTEAFGQDILDASGDVSRKKLGAIVFNDKAARERLNSILHPLIIERSRGQARHLVTEDPTCVVLLDAPLLIEAGAYDTVDLIVVVTASSETQLRRTLERSVAQGKTAYGIRSPSAD